MGFDPRAVKKQAEAEAITLQQVFDVYVARPDAIKARTRKAWGSFEAFADQIRAEIDAEALDRDFPLPHLERWERAGIG